jgi:hypothetical protein
VCVCVGARARADDAEWEDTQYDCKGRTTGVVVSMQLVTNDRINTSTTLVPHPNTASCGNKKNEVVYRRDFHTFAVWA